MNKNNAPIDVFMREQILMHFLRCEDTAGLLVKLLTSPDAKLHAATLIGSLMIAEQMAPKLDNVHGARALADINQLCRDMAKQHIKDGVLFDA